VSEGADTRRVAIGALRRIEGDAAYANLALRPILERSDLDERGRAAVTDLVYGTLRRKRSCDFLVDRFLSSPPPAVARAALRLGAYQLCFGGTPPHAAVSATVAAVPQRFRGLVNAVLRKVASTPVEWPDVGTRLSYPDWIVERLVADLGEPDAIAALEAMNQPAEVTRRADGYVQDRASQWVADVVETRPGDVVADVCAAPGGKATAIAASGADVVALDLRPKRAGLVRRNAERLEAPVLAVAGNGVRPPLRERSFDAVLVDAPCSGLGVLRRRADARWRIRPEDVVRLTEVQASLLDAAIGLVRPGGLVVYSVCTLTRAETVEQADAFAARHPELEPLGPLEDPWRPVPAGGIVLPHDAGTDGMAVFRWRIRSLP
jgi:16S rRNA (cytosine967-C5)-methyltransferase